MLEELKLKTTLQTLKTQIPYLSTYSYFIGFYKSFIKCLYTSYYVWQTNG